MQILLKVAWRPTFSAINSCRFCVSYKISAPSMKPYYFWGGVKQNWFGQACKRNTLIWCHLVMDFQRNTWKYGSAWRVWFMTFCSFATWEGCVALAGFAIPLPRQITWKQNTCCCSREMFPRFTSQQLCNSNEILLVLNWLRPAEQQNHLMRCIPIMHLTWMIKIQGGVKGWQLWDSVVSQH